MIAAIALAAVVALAASLLLYAATRPDTLRIERSVLIAALPHKIVPLINDLPRFNTWNPYNQKDPAMKGSYRGPSSGPGAAFDFDGNKNVGKGSIQIIEPSGPSRVTMTLDMTAPMACHNVINFILDPQGNATEVTWAMQGPCPFLGKLMGVIFNMDKMVGRDFESGLAGLKRIAERT
ncbi:MAG: SRPBCC family protein [Cytophagales bacterium]|nr:SRPBCC family protein [Rhizobacter sp.]